MYFWCIAVKFSKQNTEDFTYARRIYCEKSVYFCPSF